MIKLKNLFQDKYNILKENNTPVKVIEYMDFVRLQDISSIIENMKYVVSIVPYGGNVIKFLLESQDLSMDQLNKSKEAISEFFTYLNSSIITDEDIETRDAYLKTLENCIDILDTKITEKNSPEYIKENSIFNLQYEFLPGDGIINEASSVKALNQLTLAIKNNPNEINQYKEFIRGFTTGSNKMSDRDFKIILDTNTRLILFTIDFSNDNLRSKESIGTYLATVPVNIISVKIKDGIPKKYIDSYISIIKKQINTCNSNISKFSDDPVRTTVVKKYIEVLTGISQRINDLTENEKKRNKKSKITAEGFITFADCKQSLDNIYKIDLDKIFDDIFAIDNDDQSGGEDDYTDFDCEEPEIDDIFEDEELDENTLKKNVEVLLIDILDDQNPKINLEKFSKVIYMSNQLFSISEEGVGTNIARGVDNAVSGAVHGLKKIQNSGKHVSVIVNKSVERIENFFNETIQEIKKKDKDARREMIITGQWKNKLLKIIGTCLVSGGAFYIHPAIAAITLVTSIAVDKHLDQKEREKVLDELDEELKICKEKIEDAKSKGDNEKKYNLMRIQGKLERDIQRIRYNLD